MEVRAHRARAPVLYMGNNGGVPIGCCCWNQSWWCVMTIPQMLRAASAIADGSPGAPRASAGALHGEQWWCSDRMLLLESKLVVRDDHSANASRRICNC